MSTLSRRLGMKGLLVHEDYDNATAAGRAVRGIALELEQRAVEVLVARSGDDARAVIQSDPMIQIGRAHV